MTTDLQEAFREAARREFAMVPNESELDYTFSPGFQRKMQRIIRAQVHGYWNMVNTMGKRIAIAAAIIVMLLTTAMAIKPVRERVITFFIEVYEDFFEIRFGTEQKNDLDPVATSMTRYALTFVPDGYIEIDCLELETIIHTTWQNSTGFRITLQQEPGTNEITLDNIEVQPIIINHNSLRILHQQFNDTSMFIWDNDNYIFYLTIYEDFSLEDVLSMIDSVVEKK